jgi:hypothetical protein
VSKFIFEVNGVVGLLFKLCESYSEAHLYLKEHRFPSLVPRRGLFIPTHPPQRRNEAIFFKASMLDLGGLSVIGDQSKGKEGKLFGYYI